MMNAPRIALTTDSGTVFKSSRPRGIPNKVESTSQPALRTWTLRQSWITTTTATVMDTSTANGAATWTGIMQREKRHGH